MGEPKSRLESKDPLVDWINSAAIESLRNWWAGDALLARRIKNEAGLINSGVLRRIAQNYGVGRGILSGEVGKDLQKGEVLIATLLDRELREWPDGLNARCELLIRCVGTAKTSGMTKGELLSAFSKVVWFIHPKDWTMYDRFAVKGVLADLREFKSNREKFARFYSKLSDSGFEQILEKMRKEILVSRFPYLPAERIADKYFMLVGQEIHKIGKVISLDEHSFQLSIWGESIANDIEALVGRLSNAIEGEVLFSLHKTIPVPTKEKRSRREVPDQSSSTNG